MQIYKALKSNQAPKVHYPGRKSAKKFLCEKTVSDKVVRHSSAELSV